MNQNEGLHTAARRYCIERSAMWRERGGEPGREIHLESLDPSPGYSERYWLDEDAGWVVCASVENAITLAGGWLVDAMKAEWYDWYSSLWKGSDHA